MSVPGRHARYDAASSLVLASHNASQNHTAPAPSGYKSDEVAAHGSGPPDLDQMSFDLVETFHDFDIASQQDYSTASASNNAHSREDDILLDTGHENSREYPHQPSQDLESHHVNGYGAPSAHLPWNPALAAHQYSNAGRNTSQVAVHDPVYLTPPRQSFPVPSDSAYYSLSQQDTRSVRSGRSNSLNQHITPTQVTPRSIPESQKPRKSSQGHTGHASMDEKLNPGRKRPHSEVDSAADNIPCQVEGCDWKGKTPSDHKKHVARHKLVYVCEAGDCGRNRKGFATVNDLVRHQKTVHKLTIPGERVYRCFGQGCVKPEKDWPRKDNFRSHLKKTHSLEDSDILVRKSEEWWNNQQRGTSEAGGSDQALLRYSNINTPPTGYQQPLESSAIPSYSSAVSESGYNPSSTYTYGALTNAPYTPREVRYTDFFMPDTEAHAQQQQSLLSMQRSDPSGYHAVNTAFNAPRSRGNHSARAQHPSSTNATSQRRQPVHTRLSPSATLSEEQASFGGQPMAHSLSYDWASHAQQMNHQRHASISHNTLQLPNQHQFLGQRPRDVQTIADPLSSAEERRKMAHDDYSDMQSLETSSALNFPDPGNEFSYMGNNLEDDALQPSPANSNLPQLVLPESQSDQASEGSGADFNVSQLNRFVQEYAKKGDNDLGKTKLRRFLKSSLLSLDSNESVDSGETSQHDVQSEKWIEETTNDASKVGFRCRWPKCTSTKPFWKLKSEIKKHIKRHTKPYGCTFDTCYKKFGSKSDWFRHEFRKHTQLECWRCVMPTTLPGPGIQPCSRTFGKQEQFRAHLQNDHKVADPQKINDLLTSQHINSNFQPQYWCGFCKDIHQLEHKGKHGIHERYNHIAKHISDEDACMDDWRPPHGKLSKGKIRERKVAAGQPDTAAPRDIGPDENDDEDHESGPTPSDEDSIDSGDAANIQDESLNLDSPFGPLLPSAPQQASNYQNLAAPGRRRRAHSTAGSAPQQQQQRRRPTHQQQHPANFWRCSTCIEDNRWTTPVCVNGHRRSARDTPFYRRTNEEGQ